MQLIKKYWYVLAAIIIYMMMGKKKRTRRRPARSMGRNAARMYYRRPMQNPLGGYRSYVTTSRRRRPSRIRRRSMLK